LLASRDHRQAVEKRRVILDNPLAKVEHLFVGGLTRTRTPVIHSPDFQLLFPLKGVFNWHLGTTASLLDANQVLFIAAGDVSQDSHPEVGDVDGLLLTPCSALLESAWGCDAGRLRAQPAFSARVLPSEPRLQQAAAALGESGRRAVHCDDAVIEEAIVELLAVAAAHTGAPPPRTRRDSALSGAVKEIVSACDGKLSLNDIGAQLGASPAYLTDAFRRSEGIPISQYHRRLRLARALADLPHTENITALALHYGFSSHAHFSSAFRSVFGRTPSEYRARARQADFRALLQQLDRAGT
jgi:AraC-like DNA-binding protein